MVPYADVGFGYARVPDGGTATDVGAGVGAGHTVAGMNWPNESKDGGLAARGQKWERYIFRFTDTQGCYGLRKVRAVKNPSPERRVLAVPWQEHFL